MESRVDQSMDTRQIKLRIPDRPKYGYYQSPSWWTIGLIDVAYRNMWEGFLKEAQMTQRQLHLQAPPQHGCTACRQLNRLEGVLPFQMTPVQTSSTQLGSVLFLSGSWPGLRLCSFSSLGIFLPSWLVWESLNRCPTNSEKPRMPGQTVIPSKTFKHNRGRKAIHDKTKFSQHLSRNPALQK